MTTELKLHEIQAGILVHLLMHPLARFSELNTGKIPSDQFNFHLKKLVDEGLITKEKGRYKLTPSGKEFANRFDTDIKQIERQAKVSVLVCCIKKRKGTLKYLIQKRLKQPYFGYHGFFGGKIRWGETVSETASRELKEETGLRGIIKLAGVKHKMDYSEDDELLEDKFFFIFTVTGLSGKLIEKSEGGENIWLTKEEIKKLPNQFDGFDTTFKIVEAINLQFEEKKYKVKSY